MPSHLVMHDKMGEGNQICELPLVHFQHLSPSLRLSMCLSACLFVSLSLEQIPNSFRNRKCITAFNTKEYILDKMVIISFSDITLSVCLFICFSLRPSICLSAFSIRFFFFFRFCKSKSKFKNFICK